MLSLTSMLNGLSLMLLNHHLLVDGYLIELHLGVFGSFDIGLLSSVVSGLRVVSSLHYLRSAQPFDLKGLPMLSWVRFDEEALEFTVNELEFVFHIFVINSVKKVDGDEVFDGHGIDLQQAV